MLGRDATHRRVTLRITQRKVNMTGECPNGAHLLHVVQDSGVGIKKRSPASIKLPGIQIQQDILDPSLLHQLRPLVYPSLAGGKNFLQD